MVTRASTHRERLGALANNLWWSWQSDLPVLFRELSPDRWHALGHNPVALLQELSDEDLAREAREHALGDRIDDAYRRLRGYLRSHRTWGSVHAGVLRPSPVAYLSAEFGLHESLPIYSGGLGVLAGDHLKSASDLGIPLVGVGLMYRRGYFVQSVDRDGWQQETYHTLDPERLPFEPLVDAQGTPVQVSVETGEATIHARVWRVEVGRVPLFLLDAGVPENTPEDRELTARLYGGGPRARIRQELLLGVGGLRALAAAGIRPGVLHLNEGHSAFALLERCRHRVEREGVGFQEARHRVAGHVAFTTHTPVAAGHDRFTSDLVEVQLGPLRDRLGLGHEGLMTLGRERDGDGSFCMTVLALHFAEVTNGVSALHGRVSRRMWRGQYPEHTEDEIPIGHITNGVHVPTWLAPSMRGLFDRYLRSDWIAHQPDPHAWETIEHVDDAELWDVHQGLKGDLVEYLRRKACDQARTRGESTEVCDALEGAMSREALLVGFARRFATYKRAGLILRDLDVLDALVNADDRPLRFVFAGKAHPHDEGGKRLIQRIHQVSRDPRFLGKVVFLEGYEIDVARHLVQGVDVWLNNPRRPLEASGTSGQKVAINGGLNCSILDGWWAEGWDGTNGFAIGSDEVHADPAVQDLRDFEATVQVLRNEVVPLYYERDADGLPLGWLQRMKRSIRTLAWRFDADRMVRDYAELAYLPLGNGVLRQRR
ncbi:MAG: alpha-glucan family phosphorylase [Myxococcota bacterium]